MIDKREYALRKWSTCKIWGCPVCPTDSYDSMAKCIVCKKNEEREKNQKSYWDNNKRY